MKHLPNISKAKTPTDLLNFRIMLELHNAEDMPRFLIVIAHSVLELFVNGLIKAHCKNWKIILDDKRGYTQATKLVILNEVGILDKEQFTVLRAFKKLRNDAAHETIFNLTPAQLKPFLCIMPKDKKLDFEDPKNFMFICYYLVFGIFSKHKDALSKYIDDTHSDIKPPFKALFSQ